MPFIRCAHYDDDGMPIKQGCPRGGACIFVHPSHAADWQRAPTSNLALKKKNRAENSSSSLSFRPPKLPKSRWAGFGKSTTGAVSTAGPSNSGPSSADASRAASPVVGEAGGTTSPWLPAPTWGASDAGWPATQPTGRGDGSPAAFYASFNVFESDKGKGKDNASTPIAPSSATVIEPAVPPPPAPPDDPNAPPILSPVVPQTPVKSSKFSSAGFISRSDVEDKQRLEVLSSPISAMRGDRAPGGPLKPVPLSEVHTDSIKFIRQLLDAVFRTEELNAAEQHLARTKRNRYSPIYERASHVMRLKLDELRNEAEQDRFVRDERLRSRLSRIAELPNVGAHLAEIAPTLEKSNADFAQYLESVEAWREELEPHVRGVWEEFKERIRQREEDLAKDTRPEWIKQAPHLQGQYDRLVALEQSANDFKLEHEDREMETDNLLMNELLQLAQEGSQRLHETVERAKQAKVDARVKQMMDERKAQDAELRGKLDGLGDVIGTELDKEAQCGPRTGLEEYMADIRERVRRQHEVHVERVQTVKSQQAAVDELLKQTEPANAYDLPKLISDADSLVKHKVDDHVAHAVGQLVKSSDNSLASYETQQVRFLWDSSEPIRLVAQYVDSDDGRRDQARALLQEQATLQAGTLARPDVSGV